MTDRAPMQTQEAREAERDKYRRAYGTGRYRMKPARLEDAADDLAALPVRGAFLDVGCGYGQVVREAARMGYGPCVGTEVVDGLVDGETVVRAWAHALPFGDDAFSVASMIDVIEHLLPGDDEAACCELKRVTRNHVIVTANDKPSRNHIGEDLHINKRSYDEWERLLSTWFAPGTVTRLAAGRRDQGAFASCVWRIDLR